MSTLEGRKAVVTGGSRGIGAATALALAQAGAEVLLTCHTHARLGEEVAARIRKAGGLASCVPLDVMQPEQIGGFGTAVRERLGQVDVLFNNAGDMVKRVPLGEQTPEFIRTVLDLNVTSTILVTQAVLPLMKAGGVIVNMSSAAGRDGGGPGAATYAAAKGAIISLTRGWAKELAPRRIRVFAVAPGVVATDFHQRHSTPEFLAETARLSYTGGNGKPEDVARAVVYLAGEGGGFMTGVTIDLNGGRYMA